MKKNANKRSKVSFQKFRSQQKVKASIQRQKSSGNSRLPQTRRSLQAAQDDIQSEEKMNKNNKKVVKEEVSIIPKPVVQTDTINYDDDVEDED